MQIFAHTAEISTKVAEELLFFCVHHVDFEATYFQCIE